MVAIMQALATPCSALPTAASALDSSISACRSSISALESSLKATEGSSGGWETFAWVCSVVVAVGVAAEIVGIIWEYRDDLTAWRRGILTAPDRPSFVRFFWFEIFATVVVVAGIFGEAWASKELSNINSQLRSKTSELRADSDQLLALITQVAGDAVVSAEEAQQKANAAGAETDALSKRAKRINQELTMAQWALGARHVSDESGLENGLNKEFKGKLIIFKSYVQDEEAFLLCRQFVSAAAKREVGVIAVDECADEPLPPHLPVSDLRITAPTIDEAMRLAGILKRPGVSGWVVNLGVSQEITVLAGRQASIPLFWPSPKKKAPATQAPNIEAVEPKRYHYPAAPQCELSFLGYDWAVFSEFRL